MQEPDNQGHPMTVAEFTDGLIRVGLILFMVVASFRVFSPFMNLMMWALILAVTLYPMQQKLTAKMGGNSGRSATVIALIGLLILGAPIAIIGDSLVDQITDTVDAYRAGTLALPPPKPSVADWPVIGQGVFDTWTEASTNLPALVEANKTSVEAMLASALALAKSTASGVLMFMASLIVAGVMMAFGQRGSEAIYAILCRLAGKDHGPRVHALATMTTRSVAAGVLGVALIQGVLAGVGFILAGVPAPGVLAFAVLLLAIMQLPAILVILPVVIWLWNGGDSGTVMNLIWSVYLILTALSDNILKPMLLGRGVDAPMPVILIGALGGMISSGFVGLFVGAVVLAVGYQIFMEWVAMQADAATTEEGDPEAAE
jgi:predicted PurR-regulated permease PerM